jgi:hypothetical protein
MVETKSRGDELFDAVAVPIVLVIFIGLLWLACHALKYIVIWLFGI